MDQNATLGTVVIADQQKAGRGRTGNTWISRKGAGIYMSVAIKPSVEENVIPKMTFATAAAVAKAVSAISDSQPTIKWPNDIYLRDAKLAGILIEEYGDGNFVVGIGLNTNATVDDLSSIGKPATSLAIDTGKSWDQEMVLKRLLEALESEMQRLNGGAWPDIVSYVRGRSYLKDKRVHILSGDEITASGIVRDVSPDGSLLLEVKGKIEVITSGTVELDRASRPPERK